MLGSENTELRLVTLESSVQRILAIVERGQVSEGPQRAEVTPDEWQALAAKLNKFEDELSDKEKAALLIVLGAAAATFERGGATESPASSSAAVPIALRESLDRVKLGYGLMSIGSFQKTGVGAFGAAGPVSDSVNVGGDLTTIHEDWVKGAERPGGVMVRGQWNTLTAGAPAAGGNLGLATGRFGGGGLPSSRFDR